MLIIIIYLIMATLNAIYSACQTLYLNHIDYPDEPFDFYLFSTIVFNFFLWPITLPMWIFLKRKGFNTMTEYFEAKKKSKNVDKIVDIIYSCNDCGLQSIYYMDECPKCNSANISEYL